MHEYTHRLYIYQLRFACLFSLSQFPLSLRIKPRKTCNIRHLRGFSCFRENSLSHVSSYVLRVLFPLIKIGISLTAATVSSFFLTKGKIAFCVSGYRCRFSAWFLGYYHTNRVIDGRYILQWEQIPKVE